MTSCNPHSGLARIAQDELASIYRSPRGLKDPEPMTPEAILESAREILDDARRERYAGARRHLRVVDGSAAAS